MSVIPAEQWAKWKQAKDREDFAQDVYAKFTSGNDVPVTRIRVFIPGLGDLFFDTIQWQRRREHSQFRHKGESMTFEEWWSTLASPALPGGYDDAPQKNVARMAWDAALRIRPEEQRKEAFEDAAQECRYYLKHQNYPSSWDNKDEYQRGVQIACENLEKIMLERAEREPQSSGS